MIPLRVLVFLAACLGVLVTVASAEAVHPDSSAKSILSYERRFSAFATPVASPAGPPRSLSSDFEEVSTISTRTDLGSIHRRGPGLTQSELNEKRFSGRGGAPIHKDPEDGVRTGRSLDHALVPPGVEERDSAGDFAFRPGGINDLNGRSHQVEDEVAVERRFSVSSSDKDINQLGIAGRSVATGDGSLTASTTNEPRSPFSIDVDGGVDSIEKVDQRKRFSFASVGDLGTDNLIEHAKAQSKRGLQKRVEPKPTTETINDAAPHNAKRLTSPGVGSKNVPVIRRSRPAAQRRTPHPLD